MKRPAFYRRGGKAGKFSGMKERVVWMIQTRNRPVTGTEIAAVLNVSLVEFNRASKSLVMHGSQVVKIETSDWWKTEAGVKDRHYQLIGKPRVLTHRGETKLFSKKTYRWANSEMRQVCIERAERRRRLIAAGLYIDEFEAFL